METALSQNDAFISKVVYKYVLSSVASMLGTRISTLFNGIIIGNILGALGLGVMSIVSPVNLIYFTLGSLIGVGSSILSSMALGNGDKAKCDQIFTMACVCALAASVVITVLGLTNLSWLVNTLGAKAENFEYAYAFVRNYMIFGAGSIFVYIPLNYLRVTGKPGHSMRMLIMMSLLNLGFSFVFVTVFDMGTGGVGLATTLSSTITAIYGFVVILGKGKSSMRLVRFKFTWPTFGKLCLSGTPSALNNLSRAMQSMLLNLIIIGAGLGSMLACYSLYWSVADFTLAFILGVAQAVLPLVGISYGERDYTNIKRIMKKAISFGSIVIGTTALLIILFHNQVVRLFGIKDEAILLEAGKAVIFLALSLNLGFINNLLSSYFSTTKHPVLASAIVVMRMVFFIVLTAYLFIGSYGMNAIWAGYIIAEVLTFGAICLCVTIMHLRNKALSPFWLLDNERIKNSVWIDFSVENTPESIVNASEKITAFCEDNDLPPKTVMAISLSIEELLTIISDNCFAAPKGEFMDVRILLNQGVIMLRIRNAGKSFNLADYYTTCKEAGEMDKILGIQMIMNMTMSIEYRETFGMNNLSVLI